MIKVLWWRFRRYSGHFLMLTVKACSKTLLFTEWSHEVFYTLYLGDTWAMTTIFFSKCLKYYLDSRIEEKNEKMFLTCEIIAFEFRVANSPNLQLYNRGTFIFWLSKRVPKQRFLQSNLTKFFTVCSFGNKLAMNIIFLIKLFKIWCRFQKLHTLAMTTFFFKMFKISCRIQKWNKKFRKCFSIVR